MNKKQSDFLTQTAQRLHLSVDERSGTLFGEQGGLKMIMMPSTVNRDYAALVFSLTRGGQEPDAAEMKTFAKGNKLVMNCVVRRNRVEFVLKATFGSVKKIDRLEQAAQEIVAFLRSRGYQSCCQGCGQAVEAEACVMAGAPSLLCDSCYRQLGANQEQQEAAKKPENAVAGTVGALLGSIFGVGCIVLLGQLGYVAALSGIVMAVCALKGYELPGRETVNQGHCHWLRADAGDDLCGLTGWIGQSPWPSILRPVCWMPTGQFLISSMRRLLKVGHTWGAFWNCTCLC